MYIIKNIRNRKSWKFKFPTYDLARSYLRSHIKKVKKVVGNAKHISIRDYGFGISKLA